MQFPDLIGLAGSMGAGKDTVVDRVLARVDLPFVKSLFALPLRNEILEAATNGGIPVDAYGIAPTDVIEAIWRLSKLPWRLRRDRIFEKPTGSDIRRLLQWWGTDYRRRLYGEGYWTKQWKRWIQASGGIGYARRVAVTDVRFPNEMECIRECGGQVWIVRRPGVSVVNPDHPSERLPSLPDADFDRVINNTGSLEDLDREVLSGYDEAIV